MLILLLGGSSGAPARAEGGIIDGPRTGPIFVNAGETLTIVDGGSVGGANYGVIVNGGTLTMTGGSMSASIGALYVNFGGAATISGGLVTGGVSLIEVGGNSGSGGSVSITGGAMGASAYGLSVYSGTATVLGCGLSVANGRLTGTLQDGTPINIPASGPVSFTPSGIVLNGAGSMVVECHTSFTDPGAAAYDSCGGSLSLTTSGSVDVNTPGTYTITYSAPGTTPVSRTVTVVDTLPPVITLNGPSAMTVDAQRSGSFTDPGATAIDACAGSVAVTRTGSVDLTRPGTYSLTYNATDGARAAVPVTRTVTVVPVADLSVAETVARGALFRRLIFTISARNAGPQATQNVVINTSVPAGTTFVRVDRSPFTGTITRTGSAIAWNVGTLAVGQTATLTLRVDVTAPVGTTITNSSTVSGGLRDPDPGNNTASASIKF